MLFRSIQFCRNYLLAFFATYAAMSALSALGGLSASVAVLVILPPLVAAMVEGQLFIRRYGDRPDIVQCWRASLRMCALVVLIWVTVFLPMLILDAHRLAELARIDATGRVAIYLLLCFVTCCTLRVGYAIGLATELKGQQFPDR